MSETTHTAVLSRRSRASRIAMSSSGISFALNELEAISDYFGYPAFIAILAIIATDLQAAFNKRALPFGETVTACLSLFTPDYYRNKISFSLAFLIGKRSVYCKSKLTNNFTGRRITHFRISSKSAQQNNLVH